MTSRRKIAGAARFVAPYRVTSGRGFRLRDHDPSETGGLGPEASDSAKELLEESVGWLAEQQEILWAQDRWGLLLVFQAMDAAGKDGAIRHLTTGLNPQGCTVTPFGAPSSEELDHDYLWRHARHLPRRGQIAIFNRSWYEEVLVVKVHPELLARQKLPAARVSGAIWRQRYEDISAFERYLDRNGVRVVKFFLHVSKAEQKERFLKRLDRPDKHWKFSASDVAERRHWAAYQGAYEEAIRHTASRGAPWYVVPADHKWFTRLVVAATVVETIAALDLHYPVASAARRRELAAARAGLEGRKPAGSDNRPRRSTRRGS